MKNSTPYSANSPRITSTTPAENDGDLNSSSGINGTLTRFSQRMKTRISTSAAARNPSV